MMWEAWLEIESELKERTPLSPIAELLNSSQAAVLLGPVPQLTLPPNAGSPTYFQANLTEVGAMKTDVEPIDFSNTLALLESSRQADKCIERGKILAARTPTLTIQYNVLT